MTIKEAKEELKELLENACLGISPNFIQRRKDALTFAITCLEGIDEERIEKIICNWYDHLPKGVVSSPLQLKGLAHAIVEGIVKPKEE
jgi:hypothetical protein